MSQVSQHFCEWKDCTNVAAKHIVCSQSQMTGLSEKSFGSQLQKWHVNLCDAHIANLPEGYSMTDERELGQQCTDDCSGN